MAFCVLNNPHLVRGSGDVQPDIFNDFTILYDGFMRSIVHLAIEDMYSSLSINIAISDVSNIIIGIVTYEC